METSRFELAFEAATQRLVSLAPKQAGDFDFLPSDRYELRRGRGYYHFGDVDLRLRRAGEAAWRDYSSAFRAAPVTSLAAAGDVLLAGRVDVAEDAGLSSSDAGSRRPMAS